MPSMPSTKVCKLGWRQSSTSRSLILQTIAYSVPLLSLSGKVVEHEHGYRGAVAEVLALAYPSADGLQMSHRREEIETVFRQGCQEQTASPEHEKEAAVDRIVRYLTEQRERRENWTLESI